MSVATEALDRVLVVTIDRPEVRNAVDRATAGALDGAFQDFQRDATLDVAVLTGAGGTFCSGADLHAIASDDPSRWPRVEEGANAPLGPTRRRLDKPVIAAVEGHAVAGGLELALWCDLRVFARDAVVGVFCRRWGVPLMDGGTVRLPRLIGLAHALDLILTGRPVDAEEAQRIGLANRVVETDQALPEAISLARQIAAFPQGCLRGDRASALQSFDGTLTEALQREHQFGVTTLASGESVAGAGRFTAGEGRHGEFA